MCNANANTKVFGSITLGWMKHNAPYWVENEVEDKGLFSIGDTYFVRMTEKEPSWALYQLSMDAKTMHYVRLPTYGELSDIEAEYVRNCIEDFRNIPDHDFLY
jgi:hypothetical protein